MVSALMANNIIHVGCGESESFSERGSGSYIQKTLNLLASQLHLIMKSAVTGKQLDNSPWKVTVVGTSFTKMAKTLY